VGHADGSQAINDQSGHAEGDRALARFAGALRNLCPESDLVARIGGDEFVVLLTSAPPRTQTPLPTGSPRR